MSKKFPVWKINGYSLECYSDQYENHWTTKSKNYAIVSYLGHEVKVPVKIVKSPVKSIKIDKAPSYVYTYGEAEYGYMEDDVYYMWPTNFEGLKFTVTYKDGSKRSFVGEDIDEACDMLRDIFGYVCTFADRKPIFHKL